MTFPVQVFYLCDLLTGELLTELPLEATEVKRIIAREDQQTFTLTPADTACPDDWAQMLAPGHTMLVLTLDDVPTQAWAVIEAPVGKPTVDISAYSLEHTMARTNVPDYDATADESDAAVVLLAPMVDRFGFVLEHEPCGKVSDLTYSNGEDLDLLAVMNGLMAGKGGPEWRIVLRWNASKTGFTKVIEIRPRVGSVRPDVVFDLDAQGRGNISEYLRRTSYAAGKGATMLIGTSEGSGDARPMTDPQFSTLIGAGWAVWEERVNFTGLDADSVDDEDAELLSRTLETLIIREAGTKTWEITVSDNAPQPGRDYSEGDTVRIEIAPQGKQDPVGGVVDVRMLGWTLNLTDGEATPIMWEDPTEDGGS